MTVVAGVAGALASVWAWSSDEELPPPLDGLLPTPYLSGIAFTMLSAGASAGGVLWLRGAEAGLTLSSGAWAAFAALVARPAVRFNFSDGTAAYVDFPAAGRSTVSIILFFAAAGMSLATHGYSGTTRLRTARLNATIGETLVSAVLLVSGLAAAITFYVDVAKFGGAAVEKALLPLLVASFLLQALGLGVLSGWAPARAAAIAVLVAVGASAFVPDLLFQRLRVESPAVWATLCFAGAASLFFPRRVHD